ncbi:hypothetical protein [Massilia pseudoviolaceinigra]|uniref:hypothetical protein n=1 Tax=Massilia pseudoviolaceinigra TaxID=3057165 RepID=UPI0027963DE3|nr:hypothetical protein [Massilia sp. CCM 9206]MDQ1922031.1 hypothetical protein [Massilia sp. CCM 9206]
MSAQQGRDGGSFNVRQQHFPIGPHNAAALRSGKSMAARAGALSYFPRKNKRRLQMAVRSFCGKSAQW